MKREEGDNSRSLIKVKIYRAEMRKKLLVTKYKIRKWLTNVTEGTKATRKKRQTENFN